MRALLAAGADFIVCDDSERSTIAYMGVTLPGDHGRVRARFSCTSNGGRDTRLVVRGGVVDAAPLLLRELGDRGVALRPQLVLKSLVQARDLLLRGR